MIAAALSLSVALAGTPDSTAQVFTEATQAELSRSLEMHLPDQPPPYLVSYEILDGDVVTVGANMGSLSSLDHGPYRSARVQVRVGDYTMDNGNFNVSFGERSGVQSRLLATDSLSMPLRRELWLATDLAYKGATEQLSAKLAARAGHPGEHPPDLVPVSPLVTEPLPTTPVDADALASRLIALTGVLRDQAQLEEGTAVARDWQGARFLASTEGTRAWIPTGFTVVRVEAIARAADGARLRGLRWWVARDAAGLPSVEQAEGAVAEMADQLLALRDAPVEEDYLGPVLFEAPAAVELFRQLMMPELSGTPPMEEPPDPYSDRSATPVATARLGRRLLPEGWTVVDDPTRPGHAGSYDYDFEGVPGQRVELVRDGVVRDLLMSRVPRSDLQGSNGHGRALGTERRVGMPAVVRVSPKHPRSNARLRKRALALAREAGLPYVLVVRRLTPLALADDFQIAFSGEGPLPGLTTPLEVYRLYPDGHEQPVRGLEFVGVDRRVLRDVAMAGAVGPAVDVMDSGPGSRRYSIGPVGGLPSTWMVPPVVITELELRGQGGREPRVITPPPFTRD